MLKTSKPIFTILSDHFVRLVAQMSGQLYSRGKRWLFRNVLPLNAVIDQGEVFQRAV